jgi:hypothetical protein
MSFLETQVDMVASCEDAGELGAPALAADPVVSRRARRSPPTW